VSALLSGWPAAPALLSAASALLLSLIAYAYVGYPLLVRFAVRRRVAGPIASDREDWPPLTVLVAAYNEASVIERKILNALEQDYPEDRIEVLVVSDASDDGTDERVSRVRDSRVRLFRQQPRAGKTAGINRIGTEAAGEILIQTDANVMFAPGTFKALVRALDDRGVGLATGQVRFTNADTPEVASGEGVYWRFESWTKRVESDRGLLCVASGGIYAIRRSLWRPLPHNVDGDAVEPLLVAREGLLSVAVPDAIALEPAAATLHEEFHRKSRMIARQIAAARWVGLSTLPPRVLWAYASHKLMRYAVPLFAAGAFACGIAGAIGGSWLGAMCAAAVAAPIALAPLGLFPWPGPLHRVFWLPLYLVSINAAAVAGVARGIRGRAPVAWTVPPSTRPVTAEGERESDSELDRSRRVR
jgi:cellulose synthase/poly-beta-1,6-N-acetylglucosamine synthase-like glycosyltransferase